MASESIASRNTAAERKAANQAHPSKLDAEAERTIVEQRAKIAALEEEAQKLRSALKDADEVAGETLTEISAMARMAMGWLEHPDCYKTPSILLGVLQGIWSRAEVLDDNVNSYASDVGCGRHLDGLEARVHKAADAARMQEDAAAATHS